MNISRRRVLTVIGAPAAALAVWAVAVPLAGATLTVRSGDGTQTVGWVSVLVTSLLAALVALGLTLVLERVASRPTLVWTIAAPPALLASLTGPLGSGVGTTTVLVLITLHLAVAAVLVPGLLPRASRRRETAEVAGR
jgi:hypothetical protein